MLTAMGALEGTPVHLLLVTREAEFRQFGDSYPIPSNVEVKFASGAKLKPCYRNADVALLLFNRDEYMDAALPLKLFEAIGHGVPVMTYPGTAVADFVSETGAGWVVEHGQESSFLRDIHQHRELLSEKRRHLATIRSQHTWRARAEQVVATLTLQTGKPISSPPSCSSWL
jgi:glycosyltransferase involved in cell wall biosynthesis